MVSQGIHTWSLRDFGWRSSRPPWVGRADCGWRSPAVTINTPRHLSSRPSLRPLKKPSIELRTILWQVSSIFSPVLTAQPSPCKKRPQTPGEILADFVSLPMMTTSISPQMFAPKPSPSLAAQFFWLLAFSLQRPFGVDARKSLCWKASLGTGLY